MSSNWFWATAVFLLAFCAIPMVWRGPDAALAMTAQGTDRKTIATTPLDGGMEAVITLDHVTCEMTGYVLDRFSGKFFIQYRRNIAQDFPLRRDRDSRFLIAAGQADFRQFSGNERIADGVIYVAEEGSGQVVAYALPWNTQFRSSSAAPQRRAFIPLDFAKTRFIDVENLMP